MRLDINEVYRSRGKNDAICYPNNIEWISTSFSWLVNDAVRWMPCSCQCITFHSLNNFRTAISTCQCASLRPRKRCLKLVHQDCSLYTPVMKGYLFFSEG